MKRTAESRIKKCIAEQFKGKRFKSPIMVKFRWYEPNKQRDLDNICFAKKFIFDALVKSGAFDCFGLKKPPGHWQFDYEKNINKLKKLYEITKTTFLKLGKT